MDLVLSYLYASPVLSLVFFFFVRDVMREVSYDPHMGEMLTYHNNKAIDWAWFRGRLVLRKYHQWFRISYYHNQ